MSNKLNSSYARAGVDIEAGYEAVDRIKPLVASTVIPGVLGELGGFGGLFQPNLAGVSEPVLVSGTDGVGTKLKLAFLLDKHDTIGIDCVAMCVNDIACSGASPLFFLDYLAVGKNNPERVEQIVSGIAEGCRQAGCALIGGETAEMPGFYAENEYDLAGFSVGLVDKKKLIDGSTISEGDVLIGLASSGLHSNGFSLVREVFDAERANLNEYYSEFSCTLGEELLRPTKIYVRAIAHLLKNTSIPIKGISHITGGGLIENVPRILPEGLCAKIKTSAIPIQPIFHTIMEQGNISPNDMYNTFNMGIGLVMAISKNDIGAAMDALICVGERPYVIGKCVQGDKSVKLC